MKKTYKILLVLFVGIFIGCDENLDINTDPNFPGEINAGLALSSAQGALAVVVGGELTNLGGFYAQYHTQSPSASQYEIIDSYNLNITYANDLWTTLYAGCLNDLKYVTAESTANEDTASLLIAELTRAYTYQLLVDLFDAVPYTEALRMDEGIITPAATPGQEIYADLLTKIDAALAAYEANPTEAEVASQDIVYGGDMDNWVKFANTLKLKIYLRMAYTPAANAAAVTALLAEDNFLTEDAMFDNFAETADKGNPFYENVISQNGLGDVNHVASNTLHDFYVENNDPRLTAVYRPSITGTYNSIAQGTGNSFNNTASAYAKPNIYYDTPVFFMSAVESYFMQAEARVRYAGGAGAKEAYDAGVAASFETDQRIFFFFDEDDDPYEIWTPQEAATIAQGLIAPGGAYEYVPTGVIESDVRQIIVQKWASLPYINNIEAWIESTRTKFPEVVEDGTQDYSIGNRIPSAISVLSGTQVPSILFYPQDEVNRNPNITQRESLTQNVWWDQKPE
jgi:hypothetical protein